MGAKGLGLDLSYYFTASSIQNADLPNFVFGTGPMTATGIHLPESIKSNMEQMIFGALIIFFLIVEPNGLARLWQITKEKLRIWPFPH